MPPNSISPHDQSGSQRRHAARAALRHLSSVDARMRRLIERIGPFRPIITRDPFAAIIGSVIQQQVSMSSAAAVQKRVRQLCPRGRLTAKTLLAAPVQDLRAAGLSRQKAAYVKNVSAAFANRTLTAAGLRRMSDDDVVAATTAIKGIGPWTAEMLLIFCLERPDIWPVGDLGLRKAVGGFLNLNATPAPAELHGVADAWRPYRTYATWYLWRSLEGPLMPGIKL